MERRKPRQKICRKQRHARTIDLIAPTQKLRYNTVNLSILKSSFYAVCFSSLPVLKSAKCSDWTIIRVHRYLNSGY
jgi:hypothetical protein